MRVDRPFGEVAACWHADEHRRRFTRCLLPERSEDYEYVLGFHCTAAKVEFPFIHGKLRLGAWVCALALVNFSFTYGESRLGA